MVDADIAERFVPYSPAHLLSLALILAAVLLLLAFRRPLSRRRPAAGRYALAGLLAACEVLLNVWYFSSGVFRPSSTLPFELCSISLYLSVLMLLLRSRLLFQIVYFTAIGGALQALATPVLGYAFPHFRFIEFFAAHGLLLLAALYMVWVEGFRPTLRSVFVAWGALNAIAAVVFLVNRLTGANYMFLARKPPSSSLLDVLGPYPWYILSLEAVALLLFLLLYLPFARSERRAKAVAAARSVPSS
ncbi:TIGR02206 family membrane protein [Paenibacillus albicereus]|uniref:TIGR02206 family membrane protein n=1 Tax=Paenibacillus albicereus TaxID=2726185 RepID=A0A6H2H077_9BACL|nr:TIGR02206 family membrane protein [Paenibacillus albicereus]QJC53094.1 TIGR02206 family membrane protein [Paenibacillus albicereus]